MTRGTGAKGARAAVLTAFLVLFAAAAHAQSTQPQSNPGAASIGVQGHWVIEVREGDGTLVKRHEFDNALMNGGLPILQTLARQNTPGYWTVLVEDAYGVGSPCSPAFCALHESGHANVFSGSTKFVVLNVSTEGSPVPNKLVLQGTFTAPSTGQISQVQSLLQACVNTVVPGAGCTSGSSAVTLHRMQPTGPPPAGPIPIAAGQIVQVRVEITFSAAPTT